MSNAKLPDYVIIDDFKLPREVWEEIKHTYTNAPTAFEQEVSAQAIEATREVLFLVDNWIKVEDYNPCASGEVLTQAAHSLMNSKITLEMLDYNYEMQERFLEILCGVDNPQLEEKLIILLNKLDVKLNELAYLLMH